MPKAAEMLVGQTYNGMVSNKMIIMKLFIKKKTMMRMSQKYDDNDDNGLVAKT